MLVIFGACQFDYNLKDYNESSYMHQLRVRKLHPLLLLPALFVQLLCWMCALCQDGPRLPNLQQVNPQYL